MPAGDGPVTIEFVRIALFKDLALGVLEPKQPQPPEKQELIQSVDQ